MHCSYFVWVIIVLLSSSNWQLQEFREAQSNLSDIAIEANATASTANSLLTDAQALRSEAQQLEDDASRISTEDINGELFTATVSSSKRGFISGVTECWLNQANNY